MLNSKVFDVEGVWCYRLINCVLNNALFGILNIEQSIAYEWCIRIGVLGILAVQSSDKFKRYTKLNY